VRAASRPNAHVHILAIAIDSLVLAERVEEARTLVARLRSRAPTYGVEDLPRAFRFLPDTEKLFRRGAKRIGFE
jgi:hypothetical protein